MKLTKAWIPTAAVLTMLVSASGLAASSEDIPAALDDLMINGQAVTPESVQRVDLQGPLYEVRLRNGDTFYSDAHGRYMVVGNLYHNAPDGLFNVTEQNNRQGRLDQLSEIPEGGTVKYAAQGEEVATIAVFTDPTCPYCQRLHQDIEQLTASGVTVHYVPFPRAGGQSAAAQMLAQVLCSDSPQAAMTVAFQGQPLVATPTQSCQSAVDGGLRLGQRFGVQGTPIIVLPNGEMGEGYVPAQQLIQALERAKS